MTEPIRVLFVCTANICRSPFMELYARSVADESVLVSSAGAHGLDGHGISPEMAVELESRGLSSDGFLSRAITHDIVEDADLVLTAERVHRQFVLDEHPTAFRRMLTLGQVVSAAQALPATARGRDALVELARHRGLADPADDVADPFGRGAAAAGVAAQQITDMLDQFLPVLQKLTSVKGNPTHG